MTITDTTKGSEVIDVRTDLKDKPDDTGKGKTKQKRISYHHPAALHEGPNDFW